MESTPEQAAEGAAIVRVLADVLDRLVLSNAALARQDPGQVTKFHALKAPGIAILPYLERIHKYASCSNECFILALIYIDRLIQRNNFLLTELNVHRVVITAILLAAKFFDDAYYNNAYYSKVGGVLVSEMNGLEVDFLFRINFSLHVTPDLFDKYKAELVAHSISAGHAIPPPALPQLDMSHISSITPQPLHSMHGSQGHHLLPHVTPSPSHVASHNLAAVVESRPVLTIPPSMEHAVYAAEQHMLANGLTQQQQQFIHRANSLPPFTSHSGRCLYDNNPPYSAPMVSMLPVGLEDQYMVVSNQLLPLQTTLVHHHHGVHNDHVGFHPQTSSGPVHGLSSSFGSLIACLY